MQNQRLSGVDAVAFRRVESHGQHAGFLQQRLIGRGDDKLVNRFAAAGNELKRTAGQQAADAGVAEGEFRRTQFYAGVFAQQIDHAGVNSHLTGHQAARVERHFGELPDL